MAVDFEKLPPEEPVPDKPPSRFVWAIVFLVIVLAGVFAVLLFWPKGESTRTLWFWICVTVYPVGVAAFIVLRRYSVYEGRRLDAIEWNAARGEHVHSVFEHAMTVSEAMRYLCDEVFPSPCQKRNELRGAADRRNEHGRRTVLQ